MRLRRQHPVCGGTPFDGRVDGFTLVEVLVALVILSMGLLGIAALYVESLRASRTAILRTEAVVLAADLAERIRVNRLGAAAYEGAAAAEPCPAATDAATTAARDLCEWQAAIDRALPGADGTVTHDPETAVLPATYTILIEWNEAGLAGSYQLRFQI